MSDLLDARWTPSKQAAASKVGGETVLLHLVSGTYFGLDPLGTRVWEGLKSGQEPRLICATIAAEYGEPVARVEQDVCDFLEQLEGEALVERG